jgi:hypothetical protein
MVVRLKLITKLNHFIYKSHKYNFLNNKMVQLSMSGFQMTSYNSDDWLSNGLQLSNSGLSKN